MEYWIALFALWALCALPLLTFGQSCFVTRRARQIALRPSEPMLPDELFGCLLSANFATLEGDDFNQLGSSLSERRVRDVLTQHWRVQSSDECVWLIERGLRSLGVGAPAEKAAYAAWRSGYVVHSGAYAALHEICRLLVQDIRVVEASQIRDVHLSSLAWDVQQLAYLVRLGFSAGHLSRQTARRILKRLQEAACERYASWEDYSLSALIAVGVRNPIDSFDSGDWRKLARSHLVLLQAQRATFSHATRWRLAAPVALPAASRLASSAPRLSWS